MAEPNGTGPETESHSQKPDDTQNQAVGDSTTDNGLSRRPRDARVIHLMLSSMGVNAYQERVPLQIMDFAYRYTNAVLQDALLYADAGHGASGANPSINISSEDLRMSIASRVNHQFNTSLPKEFLMDLAMERNRVALPPVDKGYGIRLPPEKYCLTGVNWELVEGDELLIDDDSEDHDMEGDGPATIGAQEDGGEGEMDVDDSFGGGEGDMDNNMTDA